MSVRLKRPSLRFTHCNYGFIYMRGGCALTVHSCRMTVQCCAYTTADCALLWTVLKAQLTMETVQLCNCADCATVQHENEVCERILHIETGGG